METTSIMAPLMQFGFAGFAAALLAILVWLMRQGIKAFKRNTEVIGQFNSLVGTIIAQNDSLMKQNNEIMQQNTKAFAILTELHQKFLLVANEKKD